MELEITPEPTPEERVAIELAISQLAGSLVSPATAGWSTDVEEAEPADREA